MSASAKPIDAAGIRERAARAREFLRVAESLADAPTSATRAVATSNAVEAGIAAADAICGRRLGEHSSSERHADALALLGRAMPKDAGPRNALRRLLDVKSRAQYGSGELAPSLFAENLDRARKLVRAMDEVLDGN